MLTVVQDAESLLYTVNVNNAEKKEYTEMKSSEYAEMKPTETVTVKTDPVQNS